GPIAWVVLEEGRAAAGVDRIAVVSARHLTSTLGLGKDAVARALTRLCQQGLIERVCQSRRETGRFGHGAYIVLDDPNRHQQPHRQSSGRNAHQLTFLDTDYDTPPQEAGLPAFVVESPAPQSPHELASFDASAHPERKPEPC